CRTGARWQQRISSAGRESIASASPRRAAARPSRSPRTRLTMAGGRIGAWRSRFTRRRQPAAARETERGNSWGPGKYDPRFNFDGKSTPLVLPPAYGLAEVKNETYTAEGPISYWNAYVAITQMHGQGSFSDPRLGIDIRQ